MKIIFPVVWIPFFGLGALVGIFSSIKNGIISAFPFVLAWAGGSFFIYWYGIRLKMVSIDENNLYISNYIKTITVPLSQIYDVTENLWINLHPVTIHLKSPSEFGTKIMFMPTIRFFAFFSSHPIVAELKELAASKQDLPPHTFRY